jgi:lipoyl-dependent peroxiredoxin
MPSRIATTTWTGGLQDGSGVVSLASSGLGAFDVSFPKRAAEEAGGTTSPEELIAAAHSACFAMQLSALIAAEGGSPGDLQVSATVSLAPDPEGGFHIPNIFLKVRGRVENMDEATFVRVANAAKVGCPVSKALSGTEITLEAGLA